MKYTEQDLKDEYEQAVKRKGELYAEGYVEGLKDAQNKALNIPIVSVPLPNFLYEDNGEILIGYHGDTVVTDEWNEWKAGYER